MKTSIPTDTNGDLAADTVKLPNIRLDLANSPGNVMLVRQAFGGLADLIELDKVDLNDINTTVTEACNNVVLHAYQGGSGPLEVEVFATDANLCVVVRDHGRGLEPRSDEPEPERGIGLRLIEALADDVQHDETPGGGTELRMAFATNKARELRSPPEREGVELCAIARGELAQTARIAVTPGRLAQAVLPRVLCALAANADFSTDRISDTQLLADALLARIEGSVSSEHVNVGVNVAPRNLEIRVGPLRNGTAERLVRDSLAGLGPVLQRLTDGPHAVVPDGQAEVLKLRLASKR